MRSCCSPRHLHTSKPSALAQSHESKATTHINNLPSSRRSVVELVLNPRQHSNVTTAFNLVLVSLRDLSRCQVAVGENLLRSPGDDEDVEIIFEDFRRHDLCACGVSIVERQ